MALISISTAILTFFLVYIVKKAIVLVYRPSRPFPPGPKPLPVIGNMLDLPLSTPSKAYIEWGKKYNSKILLILEDGILIYQASSGDILYAEALGNRILVLNRVEDALEIFENQSKARMYSDRPTVPIVKL